MIDHELFFGAIFWLVGTWWHLITAALIVYIWSRLS